MQIILNDKEVERLQAAKGFTSLIDNPKLLFYWQITHTKDVLRIAAIASHKLSNHLFCADKCKIIDKFIKDNITAV